MPLFLLLNSVIFLKLTSALASASSGLLNPSSAIARFNHALLLAVHALAYSGSSFAAREKADLDSARPFVVRKFGEFGSFA